MRTLITNAWVLTMDERFTEYKYGAVGIALDGTIDYVGMAPEIEKYEKIIDGKQGLLLPGFINMHTHLGMIPFRSLGDDMPDRLRRFLFPLENEAMTSDVVYHSAKYACCEMLLSGTTTCVDMYYFEDDIARGVAEIGMRAFLGETVIDFKTCDTAAPFGGIAYADKFITKWQNHPLITPFIAPHGTNTNSPEKLQESFAVAQKHNTWFSLHVAEMDYEMKYFADKFQMSPIAFLEKIGVLNEKTIAAHCIFTDSNDHEILARNNVSVAHCVGANTKSGKGVARIREMLAAGVKVGIGTDGPSSGNTLDMFSQMNLIPKAQKTFYQDRSIFPAREVVAMGTRDGAAALHLLDEVGTIEIGKKADFILIETTSVNMYPIYDPYAAIVYSANASNVNYVWVDGVCKVAAKTLVGVDLAMIRQDLEIATKDFQILAKELEK
jgi:Cytosine deaminase and related metal-dependent hydrolases